MIENLEYNTARDHLTIKEYGRNVQNLINHITTVEDDKERNELAEVIVGMMMASNPQEKNNPEFVQKIWNHLYKISGYKIDVTKDVVDIDDEDYKKPADISYPTNRPRKRHYGSVIETMIRECSEMEEGEIKVEFVRLIVSYMKSAYKNWSKENVADDTIISDLEKMSNGKLTYDRENKIASFGGPTNNRNNNNNRRNNNNRNNNNNRRNNNNHRRR